MHAAEISRAGTSLCGGGLHHAVDVLNSCSPQVRSQFERRLEEQYAFDFVAEGQMEGSMQEDASEEYLPNGIGQLFGGER